MEAVSITEWKDRYEVSSKGREPKDADELRVGPLLYIRLKVYGHKQGTGFRKMKAAAGDRAMEVFGIFCKFLEIAGDQGREDRGSLLNERDEPATPEDLAFILDTPREQISHAMRILGKIGWIQHNLTEEEEEEEEEETTQHKQPEIPGNSRQQRDADKLNALFDKDFPDLNTPEFRQTWNAWEKHRKEKRSDLTPSTIGRQLKKLAKVGPEIAAKMIEQSIEQGWTGLYDLKPSGTGRSSGKKPAPRTANHEYPMGERINA